MRGWRGEGTRHSLARKGIKTSMNKDYSPAIRTPLELRAKILNTLKNIKVNSQEEMYAITDSGVRKWNSNLKFVNEGGRVGFIRKDVDNEYESGIGDAHTHPASLQQYPSYADMLSSLIGNDISYVIGDRYIYEIIPRTNKFFENKLNVVNLDNEFNEELKLSNVSPITFLMNYRLYDLKLNDLFILKVFDKQENRFIDWRSEELKI